LNLHTTVENGLSLINGKVFSREQARRPARLLTTFKLSGERREMGPPPNPSGGGAYEQDLLGVSSFLFYFLGSSHTKNFKR